MAANRGQQQRVLEPLQVDLSVRFRFGDGPGEQVAMLENYRVPLVGSALAQGNRILRGFLGLLLRAAATQPRVRAALFSRVDGQSPPWRPNT